MTDRAGAAFGRSEVSRGLAFGDVDNDGDTDVVVANAAGRVELLVNQVGHRRDWIGLRLVGGATPRDMPGRARDRQRLGRGDASHRRARVDGSYASAHDPRVLIGLGDEAADALAVEVVWPDGRVEAWSDVPIGRYSTLAAGARDGRDDPASTRGATAMRMAAGWTRGGARTVGLLAVVAVATACGGRRVIRFERCGVARSIRARVVGAAARRSARSVAAGAAGAGAGARALRRGVACSRRFRCVIAGAGGRLRRARPDS